MARSLDVVYQPTLYYRRMMIVWPRPEVLVLLIQLCGRQIYAWARGCHNNLLVLMHALSTKEYSIFTKCSIYMSRINYVPEATENDAFEPAKKVELCGQARLDSGISCAHIEPNDKYDQKTC